MWATGRTAGLRCMFSTPPDQALGIQRGKPIDFNDAGTSLAGLLIRMLLLLVMGVVGSLIANRGITLYTESRGLKLVQEEATPPETA